MIFHTSGELPVRHGKNSVPLLQQKGTVRQENHDICTKMHPSQALALHPHQSRKSSRNSHMQKAELLKNLMCHVSQRKACDSTLDRTSSTAFSAKLSDDKNSNFIFGCMGDRFHYSHVNRRE